MKVREGFSEDMFWRLHQSAKRRKSGYPSLLEIYESREEAIELAKKIDNYEARKMLVNRYWRWFRIWNRVAKLYEEQDPGRYTLVMAVILNERGSKLVTSVKPEVER